MLIASAGILVQVQGSSQTISSASNLAELVAGMQISSRRFAVEVNGVIIPRSQWASTPLQAGDRIEVVHAVGGG